MCGQCWDSISRCTGCGGDVAGILQLRSVCLFFVLKSETSFMASQNKTPLPYPLHTLSRHQRAKTRTTTHQEGWSREASNANS